MVALFLSGINYSFSCTQTLQYVELAMHQKFFFLEVRTKMSLTPAPILSFIARFPAFLQTNLNYTKLKAITMGTSSKLHYGIHLKIPPKLLEVFLRHLSYCCRKNFNDAYNTINLVSQFNRIQDTATELGSKDTFLRTWNSLQASDKSLNVQFN